MEKEIIKILKVTSKGKKFIVSIDTNDEEYKFSENEIVSNRIIKGALFTKEEWDQIINNQSKSLLFDQMLHFIDYKLRTKKERIEMYNWLDKLEFEMLELPKADIKIFLHMPYKVASELKKDRVEALDQNEASKRHLLKAERTYLEVADLYDFKYIKCSKRNRPRKIEDINDELYEFVYNYLDNKITNELINFDIKTTNEEVEDNTLETEENFKGEELVVTN